MLDLRPASELYRTEFLHHDDPGTTVLLRHPITQPAPDPPAAAPRSPPHPRTTPAAQILARAAARPPS